ncbi:MAG: PcfJ domain-containing protein [Candidatus Azobacteroides sp.]|nr:PcfJ domain-containing protein [Candidatus Azobacteroides sp.]
MKPKNKFQKQVFELSKKLTPITQVQKEWAFENCFEHVGRRTSKGIVTCTECGHSWQGNSRLSDTLLGAECPKCSAKLKVTTTRKRVFKQSAYFCIVTTKGNFQVLRFFLIRYYAKAGQKAQYFISEVVQRWIAVGGKYATIARLRPMSYYDDTWCFWSALELRPERDHHRISPTCVYPRQKLIPELKRSGYKGENYNLTHFTLFLTLLSDSRAETLLKAGQTKALTYFASRDFQSVGDYWASIKICIRNGYHIEDVSIWKDYIDLLRFFGKDLHNAKYVCPADLTAEHDTYVRKKREYQEWERRERKKRKASEDEATFKGLKSRFFGIQFTDGIIQVRMLESVDEIMREGDVMHHCVFANEYHLKPDSLILSACVNGQKVETIEFSLSKMQVVQSRGVCNKTTEYHKHIIELVNRNRRIIQKRMAA